MDQPSRGAPSSWLAALERGRADIATGHVPELELFLQALEAEDAVELAAEQLTRAKLDAKG